MHRCGKVTQSLFALAKRGRRLALASLLVKSEVGVADAWVSDGLTKAEADAMIAQIVAGAEAVEVSIGLLEQRLADALAINVARDVPPPFGLLQVAESLGWLRSTPKSFHRQRWWRHLLRTCRQRGQIRRRHWLRTKLRPNGSGSLRPSHRGSRRARLLKGFCNR